MAEATILDPMPQEHLQLLLPRGINIVSAERYGGATRYTISGKELSEGKAYHLVSTDGPLLRCLELVEDDFEEDGTLSADEPQPRKTAA